VAGRLRGATLSCFSELAMSRWSRLARVSGCFALMTQNAHVRRYHGGCASKNRHARALARSFFR
jgi:hypothetical protein